jgi:hypothetical protein
MMLEVTYSIGVVIAAVVICVIAFAYTYGRQMISDRFANTPERGPDLVSSEQVSNYFRELGYIVCHSTPVINTDKWVAFLIKDGKYHIVTVFTDKDTILGHDYSLV